MNKDKRNNIQLLGTLNNADESGIIANANQIYDANEDKSTQDVSKEHKERIKTLEDKENSMQATLENISKTGEASAASNVTYNHNDSKLDATNVQQAVDEVKALLDNKANKVDVVFDISAYHATGGTLATYDNLEDALGTNGENIPQSLRKGGMFVKFVQSSDNKYVQYFLTKDEWSVSVKDWEKINLEEEVEDEIFSIKNNGNLLFPMTICNLYYNTALNKVLQGSEIWNGFLIYLPKGSLRFYIKGPTPFYGSAFQYFYNKPTINSVKDGEGNISSIGTNGYRIYSVSSNENGLYCLITVEVSKQNISDYILNPYYGDITDIQGDITDIQGDITDIQGDITDISDNIINTNINNLCNAKKAGIYYGASSVLPAFSPWDSFVVYLYPGITEFYVKNLSWLNWHSPIVYFNTKPQVGDIKAGDLIISTADANGFRKVSIPNNPNGIWAMITEREDYVNISNVILSSSSINMPSKVLELEERTDILALYQGQQNYVIPINTRLAQNFYPPKLGKWKFKLTTESSLLTKYSLYAQRAGGTNLDSIQNISIGQEVTFDLPEGTDRVLIFNNGFSSSTETPITLFYFLDSDLNNELDNLQQQIDELQPTTSLLTEQIKEPGSLLTQDEINLILSKNRKLIYSNSNAPIVAFVYDDNYIQSYVDMFEARGLKISFAIIGNITKAAWATTGNAIRECQKRGHGTCAHGVVGGISVTGSGVDTMNDADVKKATEGENKAFDDYKLSHRGLAQYNTWSDNPHTWSLMGKYYDYLLGFDNNKCINTPGETDLYELRRMWTDYPNQFNNQKAKIDEAIAKGDCLLIFGGHFSRTGRGGSYSTMEEFTQLLDYVESKVNDGLMISLNVDDAIDMLWGRASAHNVICYKDYKYRNPLKNALKIDSGVIKRCTSIGNKAIYEIEISGTITTGSFTLNLGNSTKTEDSGNVNYVQSLVISTTTGQSINDIRDSIISQIFKAYTVRKSSENNKVNFYRDINGVTFAPFISDNTSGLSFNITRIQEGIEAIWE